MEAIKIGFTGNRFGLNNNQKKQILDILDQYNNIIVSHGDCIGSDTDFHNLCVDYRNKNQTKKILIHIYPPNNSTLRGFNNGDIIMKTQPYLKRNLDIIQNSSILIGCPINKNKEEIRSGTWSTIRQAKKRNILVYIF